MLEQLFQHGNVRKVNFPTLCSAGDSGAFNDWQESILVTCDEVMSGTNNKYKVYEGLKDLFDPKPKQTLINTKYGAQRPVTLYTSYLLLTNHTDAIGALGDDRRVYTIQNTITRNEPEYYEDLNNWIATLDEQGEPRWARSVWRWLHTLKPDVKMLNSPAPMTAGKQEMIEETSSICDVMHNLIFDELGGVISVPVVLSIAEDVLYERGAEDVEQLVGVIKRKCNTESQTITASGAVKPIVKIQGKTHRLRVCHEFLRQERYSGVDKIPETKLLAYIEAAKTSIADALADNKGVVTRVNALLDERGL